MANIKISELDELGVLSYQDEIPIVDVSEKETKKIKVRAIRLIIFQLQLLRKHKQPSKQVRVEVGQSQIQPLKLKMTELCQRSHLPLQLQRIHLKRKILTRKLKKTTA